MIALERLAEEALKHWKLVAAGMAIAVLSVLLVLARHDAADWQRAAIAADKAVTTLELRNRVTLTSLDQCTGFLTEQNAAAEARAAELHAAEVANARSVATADARRDADRGRLAALETLVRAPERPGCRADDALLRGLEGL